MKKEVIIEGMSCEGCAQNVSKLFLGLDGVDRVLVDREAKNAVVEANREIPKEEFSQALAETNYTVVEVK